MSISYADSLKAARDILNGNQSDIADTSAVARSDIMTLDVQPAADTNMIAAYSGDMDLILSEKYLFYPDYADEHVSEIDSRKNIVLNQEQINLTQETNSQFIPFRMNRYYDGFDLMSTSLLIHFVNKDGYEDYAIPINVYYNSEKIRFGWLVDKRVTAIAGKVSFEIHAVGVNSKGDEYIWKTNPTDQLNILESLCGNGVIEPDETWMTGFLTQITEQVALAQQAAQDAENTAGTVQNYAQQAADSATQAQNVVGDAKAELEQTVEATVNDKVTAALAGYYTKDEIDATITVLSEQLDDVQQQIDNMDGLAAFNVEYDGSTMIFYNGDSAMKAIEINSDPTAEWTTAYTAIVEEKIATATSAVQTDLDSYKQTVNADLEAIHSDIDGLPETLANDYYTKTDADDKFATKTALAETNQKVTAVESVAKTNKEDIDTLSDTVVQLQTDVDSIDKSPRLTYDITYNENGDYKVQFYEIQFEGDSEKEVKTLKSSFVIQGGSGGSGTSSVLKIEYVTKTPIVVTTSDKVEITYKFSGTDSSGDDVLEGNASWKVGNSIVATETVAAGENTFDLTEYIKLGTQKITLSITDEAGSLVTKTWTVQQIDVRLESNFNDKITYPMGAVAFDYTPYGAVSKDVHFILDGEEIGTVTTSASGIPMGYTLPAQTHGAHLLETYITATINNNLVESDHVFKDIMWYDSTSDMPVIGTVYQKFTALQYATTNIVATVVDPSTETPTVQLMEDGELISTMILTESTFTWQYKSTEVGTHNLQIVCGNAVKNITATIEKLDIDIEPVTTGLVFDFDPTGKSNNDTDRVWSTDTVAMTVSDNFDWVNGGYQIDENGDQYFCIKAGTSAEIDYKLFADDAKKNGKEFKLVFKTTNVRNADAKFLTCINNTTDSDHIGIEMMAHEAIIYAQAGNLSLPYSEDDIIEFEFNISKNTEDVPMIMGYEDGVSTRPLVYTDSHGFTQNSPQVITLGSDMCDLHIYRFKVYNTSLKAEYILNNFIADARNAEEMIDRYNRNKIYDENNALDPYVLAEKCPDLRVFIVSAPYFTNNKSDKVPYTKIECIYKNGDPILDNWIAYNVSHSGQGTSSNNYGAAARNLDFILNNSQVEGLDPYIELSDGTIVDKISLTRKSVPVNYLNFKANVASSNNLTNAMLAMRYNEYQPYQRPFVREEGVDTSFIKDTMEFQNAVVFIQETDPDVSTHREFADTNTHFYCIGNIGDSKKTDQTRLTDQNDPYECCVEIMDVELPLSDWPADTMYNAMGYNVDKISGEKIYIWAKNENLGMLHELIDGEYVLTEDTEVNLNKTYYVDILEHDDFSEDFTYGWRYISDDENPDVVDYCKQKWIEMYRFVTTSTDEEFKEHIGDYFVLDTVFYYYLFTTRYTMIDNRRKNSFWHYSKTGEVDDEGNPIRKWMLDWTYDCDSSLGLNNYGYLAYRYGLEDTDVDGKGEEVFRESDSTFFCRIRDLFPSELKAMYNTLESQNAWHAESFINKGDAWQSQFPEELWRLNIERLYIRTHNESFINGAGDPQFLVNMANGKMKYQRRQWERDQEKYMASKYQSSVASSDNAVLRCTAPTGNLVVPADYKLKLTPYGYMYLNVKYGTQAPIQVKAEPGKTYEIPFDGSSADIVDIYSASFIQDFGDLSTLYPATVDTSRATRLKELNIGNATTGYDNPSLTTVTLGANYLLEKLNLENVSGFNQALNLSELKNLKELYAQGSAITGVTFANGGNIETAELPAISAMSMKNLIYLTTLDIASLNKLTTLTVENCDTIDLITIFENAENLNRVRITGVEWVLTDTSLLERIYNMAGIDRDGYNIERAVLAGTVHVPVIRQQQLREFNAAWNDLEITYDTLIEQFPVTFVNDDGTVLEVQYVDKGSNAVDLATRTDNPLIPTKASSVSHDFTFAGWDGSLEAVFEARTIKATYTSSLREYTIKYVSQGVTLQASKGLYGSYIPYTGSTPVYTLQESAFAYYLFNRWDKSGYIDGEKTVNAIFDRFEYTTTAFDGRELADLSPVEIYALTKLNETGKLNIQNIITDKDPYTFTLGNDIDYEDIESEVLISETTVFNGTNYIDTGIALFEEDRDFIVAIDYEFDSAVTNSVLAQCYLGNGSVGFQLYYNNGVKLKWGSDEVGITSVNKREMLIIRHKKGDTNLTVYNSRLDGNSVEIATLASKDPTSTSTLVFGCNKKTSTNFTDYASGKIHWAKVWYSDLGDEVCQSLAMWVHEELTLEACGFNKYYLSSNADKMCTFSMLASHLLGRTKVWNTSSTNGNVGGWATSALNEALNSRLYYAMPSQIRQLMKQVVIPSSVGGMSTELSTSDCYITVPSLIEVDSTRNTAPYNNEGETISYMNTNESRKRAFDGGDYADYWLRSPNVGYTNYIWHIDENGATQGITNATSSLGVLIMISF